MRSATAPGRSTVEMPGRVEIALLRILVRDHPRLGRPAYPEARVVPAHTALALRGVESRDEVERLGILFERQETVGKAARHIHHAPVLGAELGAKALPETRRPRPQIEDRIPQRAAHAAHHLHFRRAR